MKKFITLVAAVAVALVTLHPTNLPAQEGGRGSGFIGRITGMDSKKQMLTVTNEDTKDTMQVMVMDEVEIVDEDGNKMTMKDLEKARVVRVMTGGRNGGVTTIIIMKAK